MNDVVMQILSIYCKSTNYYFIDTGDGLLAFDAGWPGIYKEYKDALKAQGFGIKDIRWLIVSHFHMDHAGLAGMLLDKGVQFFVFNIQVPWIAEMEALIATKDINYHRIDLSKLSVADIADSRQILNSIGIQGEVIHTPGHAIHHVTLLLDSGEAFIGDMPHEQMITEDDVAARKDWDLLRSKGATWIKPAHMNEYDI